MVLHVLLEFLDEAEDVSFGGEGVVFDQWCEVYAESDALGIVHRVAVEESCVGTAASFDGEIVAFASADLLDEESIQLRR